MLIIEIMEITMEVVLNEDWLIVLLRFFIPVVNTRETEIRY